MFNLGINTLKKMKEAENFLSSDDFEKFYSAIPKIEWIEYNYGPSRAYTKGLQIRDLQVLFRLMYGCGLRVTEARELKTSDFDLENRFLFVRTQKGIQKTTILPTDIQMLKDYLPKEDKIIQIQ